ncbi:MAG: hypothetical protein Q7T26_01705 [Dehalococcoidia bacterium]|nr:hypothetical protein [Dehalococcoidia bacterium]
MGPPAEGGAGVRRQCDPALIRWLETILGTEHVAGKREGGASANGRGMLTGPHAAWSLRLLSARYTRTWTRSSVTSPSLMALLGPEA